MKRIFCLCLTVILLAGTLPLMISAAPEVAAKSALLMDVATGTVLYEQNPHEKLPPASVTKVMTMLLIMEAIDGGRIGWEDMVTASDTAAAKGGSQIYLKVGETMTVRDMVKSIAVSSANDCACAMAEHIAGSEAAFVDMMNEKAKELGMNDTKFVNCTGLDDDAAAAEHKTSAYDIALMSRELLGKHPAIKEFTTIWMDTVRGGTFGLSNTNKLVRFYSGATGLKTGFTAAAGYCLSASAMREDMELIAVVMGSETSQQRFAACKSLLDYGFAGFAVVLPRLEETAAVPVKLGTAPAVTAILSEPAPMLVEKGQKKLITTCLQLEAEVTAPVSRGQRLGTLEVVAGEQILAQLPLVAEEAVEKVTWWQMYRSLLKKLAFGE